MIDDMMIKYKRAKYIIKDDWFIKQETISILIIREKGCIKDKYFGLKILLKLVE